MIRALLALIFGLLFGAGLSWSSYVCAGFGEGVMFPFLVSSAPIGYPWLALAANERLQALAFISPMLVWSLLFWLAERAKTKTGSRTFIAIYLIHIGTGLTYAVLFEAGHYAFRNCLARVWAFVPLILVFWFVLFSGGTVCIWNLWKENSTAR
jgi:hypothetical protein